MHAQITTVIPTRQRPRLLARAIRSAAAQAGVHVRVRVSDNASRDETESVVAALRAEGLDIDYRCHPEDVGALANFCGAVEPMDSPYFSLLADDDLLLPGFYARAIAALDATPAAAFWIGTTLNIGGDGRIWDARMDRWPRDGLYFPPEGAHRQLAGLAPNWTGIVFRSRLLREFGFVDQHVRGPADLDYTLRLGLRYPFIVERVPVAAFTLSADSVSGTQHVASIWPGWQRMFANLQAMDDVDEGARRGLVEALMVEGRKMLFRRGLNAAARDRPEFVADAARALHAEPGGKSAARLLQLIGLCLRIPGATRMLAALYHAVERRTLLKRADLETRFGNVLRLGESIASAGATHPACK